MKELYLVSLGKLTIKDIDNNGNYTFYEMPDVTFNKEYIKNNRISREDYYFLEYKGINLKESIEWRGVKNIYHFTPLDNLYLILTKGILPRIYLYDKDNTGNFKVDFINARFPASLNDPERYDDLPNTVSFSISKMNKPLLNAYKRRYPGRQYCVLRLDSSLIVKAFMKEYFFYHNSASSVFSGNKEVFLNGKYFNKMFYNELKFDNKYFLRNNRARYLTTSEQAEIMIKGIIPSNFIQEIIFFEENDYLDYISKYSNINLKPFLIVNNI